MQSTCVSPKRTRQEPSACLATPRSSVTGRSSSGARLEGRMPCSHGRSVGLWCPEWRPCYAKRGARVKRGACQGDPAAAISEGRTHTTMSSFVAAPTASTALDQRSREIFRRIVESYLETGEPVGSRNVSRILPTALSPASVRNVMADLEDLGPDLRAAYQRRAPADRGRPALLHRLAAGGRRPLRRRAPAHRGAR